MKKLFLEIMPAALVLSLLAAAPAWAIQEVKAPEMVVSSTKTKASMDQVPSTVFLVGQQEIDEKGIWSLPDALRSVPGVWVRGNGVFGGPTSITMRGSQTGQVRLMLDGVRLADPIDSSAAFNLSLFDVGAVDQIEVVQGPQSVLFGSDAVGGVINLLTRRGQGKPSFWLKTEGGSQSTFRGQVGGQGEVEKFNFSFSGSGMSTQGISSAKDQPESDSYNNTQFNTRLGFKITPDAELYAIGYFHKAKTNYDSFWSAPADSPDWVKSTVWTGILGLKQKFNSWWDHKLTLASSRSKREYYDESQYDSRLTSAEWQHNLTYGNLGVLTLGVDWEEEEGDYDSPLYSDSLDTQRSHDLGLYLQALATPVKGLFLTAGLRNDNYKEFGDQLSYRLAAAYSFARTGTKLRATYGTGFKAPTLYQLYSQFGSTELEPEKSEGWDIGVDQKLMDGKVKLSLTYFQNQTEDLIVYDFLTSRYANVGEAESSGLEFAVKVRFNRWLSMDGSYTYTQSEDKDTGLDLRYVPQDKFSLGFRVAPLPGLVARIYGIYVGKRYADAANTQEVDAYTLVNCALSYEVNRYLTITGRVVNLFDEDYEDVLNYGTLGLSGYLGVSISY